MKQLKMPPPIVLGTNDPLIGVRLQIMFDTEGILRLAVVLSVQGEEWPPFFCATLTEALEEVKSIFWILDAYGPCSGRARGSEDCWSFPDDDRDDMSEDTVGTED